MKKIRTFKCSECKASFDRMVNDNELIVNCECSGLANRTLSAARYFGNTVGKSPSAK